MPKFTKKKIILLVIVALIVIGGIFVLMRGDKEELEFVVVVRGSLTEEVGVTGRVKALDEAELAFERSGRVARVYKSVGDRVKKGDILASLDNSELSADLSQAKARVRGEEAQLAELKKGTREETIQITQSKLDKAKQDLENLYSDVPNILSDAFNKANDAVNTKTDILFSDDATQRPELTFVVADQQIELDAEFQRFLVGIVLSELKAVVDTLPQDSGFYEKSLENAKDKLLAVDAFLAKVIDALNASSGLTSSTLASYKADVVTGQTNVNIELSAIDDQLQAIKSQELTVETTQNELNLELAGSTDEAIEIQEALLDEAHAQVRKIEAQIVKNILRSPIPGVVTLQDARVGEIVSANTVVASVITENLYEIEAFVPEADIALVEKGDQARFTLDAFGGDVMFEAEVLTIDPAETVIEGVSTYKITLAFKDNEGTVRSGMTANIDIITAQKGNVLFVPGRAISERDGKKFVKVLDDDGAYTETQVETGIRDIFGNMEITEGLEEGVSVITFIPEK